MRWLWGWLVPALVVTVFVFLLLTTEPGEGNPCIRPDGSLSPDYICDSEGHVLPEYR